jgi:hypothetical protein
MTYDPTQPAAGTSPASVRSTIQQNFNQANIAIGRDHIPFDGPSDEGRHRKVTLVEVQTGSDPIIAGTQTAVYSKTVDATQQLFFKNSAGEKALTQANVPNPQWPIVAFGRFTIASGSLAPTLVAESHFGVISVTYVTNQRWVVQVSFDPRKCAIIATANLGTGAGRGTLVTNLSASSFGLTYRDGNGAFKGAEISGFNFILVRNT